ncbi:hypothetical protein Droror1_Dr00024468 [Drosera rotundifolia]
MADNEEHAPTRWRKRRFVDGDDDDDGDQMEENYTSKPVVGEPILDPSPETLKKVKSLEIMPGVGEETPDKDPVGMLFRPKCCFFTAKELSSCITASEITRVFCSILIALLVVLSYIDYPLLGINIVNSKSIIAAKPLYMLLLTDITILVGHLVLARRKRIELLHEQDMKGDEEDGGETWASAVRILERGLVAHQTIRAIFIDCSLYVVIISCGLSLI